jgi:hypothetical protein
MGSNEIGHQFSHAVVGGVGCPGDLQHSPVVAVIHLECSNAIFNMVWRREKINLLIGRKNHVHYAFDVTLGITLFSCM